MQGRRRAHSVCLIAGLLLAATNAAGQGSFVNFESGHVRPLTLSPDGTRLFAVNTPDNRLAIYTVSAGGLTLASEVAVGLEPVAVAARSNGEVWVVNHLSDSISIVDVASTPPRVRRTLLVGDEPRDIVFAGPSNSRAFITAAHRGQNRPGDPQLTTQGVGRSDVWVFDATNDTTLGAALGGTPMGGAPIVLFGDTPRALARSTDGSTVYVAVFHSGNRTTTITEAFVSSNGGMPPNPPGSTANPPDTGLIVRFNGTNWVDEIGRNWNAGVAFSLTDQDVFAINANGSPNPTATGVSATGVGSVIFNMAVRPNASGQLYVANTEARNHVRFEPLIANDAPLNRGVQGHIAESRISVIANPATAPAVTPRHLNPHINYACVPPGCTPPVSEVEASLAFPMDMTFSSNGARLYVVGFGSEKVAIFDAAALEAGTINAGTKTLVEVGEGPSGLVLDEPRNRLYVMNRIEHSISIVSNASNPATAIETAVVALRYDPSPAAARVGRRFLYDARSTSAHGDSACASCHIFGDLDSLAWDLGNPFGAIEPNPNPFIIGSAAPFHPLKGPMTTQSLRGMAAAGPMHWRGDRTNASDPLDEDLAFKEFNPAFVGLLGRQNQLTTGEMQDFTDFILTVRYPPNPIRNLDNTLTTGSAEDQGNTFFHTNGVDGGATCVFCHTDPLGTGGLSTFEGEPQEFKVAHLRNLYQKVGMFGVPNGVPIPPNPVGNQVRGFAYLHDGSVSTVFNFLQAPVFNFGSGALGITRRRNVEAFMMRFDTGLAPIVGQQVSATPTTFADGTVTARINLLIAQAELGNCDVIVKGSIAGEQRGAVYLTATNNFRPDRASEPNLSPAALLNLAQTSGQEITYTAVPPGSGNRMGIDRDEDGFRDRTELDAGSDPANPLSVPGATTTTTSTSSSTSSSVAASTTSTTSTSTSSTTSSTIAGGPTVLITTTKLDLKDDQVAPLDPAKRRLTFKSNTKREPPANRITPPPPGTSGDPTLHGATLQVYNTGTPGTSDQVTVLLPPVDFTFGSEWSAIGGSVPKGFKYRGRDPNGPVSKVTVLADKIIVKAGRAGWGYTLDEAQQGSIALRLQLGSATTWCAEGGRTPLPARDEPGKWKAEPKTPAPASCPAP